MRSLPDAIVRRYLAKAWMLGALVGFRYSIDVLPSSAGFEVMCAEEMCLKPTWYPDWKVPNGPRRLFSFARGRPTVG